jgi:hypothetical protein
MKLLCLLDNKDMKQKKWIVFETFVPLSRYGDLEGGEILFSEIK